MPTNQSDMEMECDEHDHKVITHSNTLHDAKTNEVQHHATWRVKAEWAILADGARALASYNEEDQEEIINRFQRDGFAQEIALQFLRDEHIFISPAQIGLSRHGHYCHREMITNQDESIYIDTPAEAVAVIQALMMWQYEQNDWRQATGPINANLRNPHDRCEIPNCRVGHAKRCPSALHDSKFGRLCGAHFQASSFLNVFELSDDEWLGLAAGGQDNRAFRPWGPRWLRDLIWNLGGCMETFCPHYLNSVGTYAFDPFNEFLVICKTCQKDLLIR